MFPENRLCPVTGLSCNDPLCLAGPCEGSKIIQIIETCFTTVVHVAQDGAQEQANNVFSLGSGIIKQRLERRPDLVEVVWQKAHEDLLGK
jgi:hypothetical protein